MSLKPESEQILRDFGMDEKSLSVLRNAEVTVSPEVFASWVKVAARAGAARTPDPYRWYSPAELIGQARAAERFSK